jgi:hypothetical protein
MPVTLLLELKTHETPLFLITDHANRKFMLHLGPFACSLAVSLGNLAPDILFLSLHIHR